MENENYSETFLSINEFSKKLNVHPNTIRRAIKKGKLNAVNIGTGKRFIYRIPASEINRIALLDLREILKEMIEKEFSDQILNNHKSILEMNKNHND